MSTTVCIKVPKPKGDPVCYISLFNSELLGTRGKKVLVNYPVTFHTREPRYVPASWIAFRYEV